MTQADGKRVTVVNLMTSSYSGATWLNLLMDTHSRIFGVGEIDYIAKLGAGTCSVHGAACPFWADIKPVNDPSLYLQLAEKSGKKVLFVNKSRRMLDAQKHPLIDQRFLFMVRDGRAVVASRLRKYPHMKTWDACRWWAKSIRKKERIVRRYPRQHVLDLRYETLQQDREGELKRICDFVGVAYEPGMNDWLSQDHHCIGGSGSVIDQLRRKYGHDAGRSPDAPVDTNIVARDFYDKQDAKAFVDDRWKKELTSGQLKQFWLIAGRTNKHYGYPSGWPS
ncbi:MAG: hypothetical protein GC162_13925 [Planctomycetes bacterium]|nr:hypothetical protein [Planctomycetota bacterium]